MDTEIIPDQQTLLAQLAQANHTSDALACDLRVIDDELNGLATDRKRHQLLVDVCGSLEELEKLEGSQLFWGDSITVDASKEYRSSVLARVETFHQRIREIEHRRFNVIEQIKQQ